MSRHTIRLLVVLATICIVGITMTQVYWVRRALNMRERQFNHQVQIALRSVVGNLCDYNGVDALKSNPINQISDAYYTVMVNDFIDPKQLEAFLISAFKKREITSDFEYGIYDCSGENMVYGNYVDLDSKNTGQSSSMAFPKLDRNEYYFGVYFPNKDSNLVGEMGIWAFSSFVLLVVIVFFGYTMFVILKQKRLSEVQRDFVNNMTHEFKTPLSTIAISSDVLSKPTITKDPDRLHNYAKIIGEEARRLKSQVERVLHMATSDKKAIKLNREQLDVHEVIELAIARARLTDNWEECCIELETKAEKSTMVGDKLHLTNIFFNLIDNAMKYCQKQPQISISSENNGKNVQIHVRDNGVGIAQHHRKKVFRQFYRVPTGNLHDVKGFGLGLSYVYKMIKAHGGRVWLQSEAGHGTTFTVALPVSH